MTQYLILIYSDENKRANASPDESADTLKQHREFGAVNESALLGGNALQPTATATVIRKDPGMDVTVSDGPFIETKEALGGYYLIDVPDLDAALAVAKQVPLPYGGALEVRPVLIFD